MSNAEPRRLPPIPAPPEPRDVRGRTPKPTPYEWRGWAADILVRTPEPTLKNRARIALRKVALRWRRWRLGRAQGAQRRHQPRILRLARAKHRAAALLFRAQGRL